MLPRPGGWLSRCCAYQGSFRKSSKSVVNSVVHIRESAYFSRLCRDNQGCYTKHIYLCLEDSRYSFAHGREFIQPYMESPAKCLRHFAGKALKTAAMADFLTCPSSHPFYHHRTSFATQMVHRSAACARQSLTASQMASLVNVADETASTSQVCASTIWEGISSIARSEIFTVSL